MGKHRAIGILLCIGIVGAVLFSLHGGANLQVLLPSLGVVGMAVNLEETIRSAATTKKLRTSVRL